MLKKAFCRSSYQISDLLSANKWFIVLSTAAGSLFKSLPLAASGHVETNKIPD
jgi:hypothetical protein